MNLRTSAKRWVGLPSVEEQTAALVRQGACRFALDIGCGSASPLTALRPALHTVGLDAFPQAIEVARARQLHDDYVLADVMDSSAEAIRSRCGVQQFDLVTLYDVIEHLPKRRGYELLEKCEQLTSKYVLVLTPNGFLEQGPEFGNEYQRHLSGWFIHDFEGLGYRVQGTGGTRCFHGYAGNLKCRFPGALYCDALLAWLLRIHRRPRHAFGLLAVKDVRGVPARLPPGESGS